MKQQSVREMAQAAVANNSVSTQQLSMAAAATQWLNLNQTNDCQSATVTIESLNVQQASLQQQIVQAEQNFNSQLMVPTYKNFCLEKIFFLCGSKHSFCP